jgi:hypothetical protein
MALKSHSTIDSVLSACKKLPTFQNLPTLTEDTRKILALFYKTIRGPFSTEVKSHEDDLEQIVKPPLVISFHPKLSLLNNNVHESLMAVKLAEKLDQTPLWIPYVYDTATHSAAEGGKIRAPTYAYIENEFIQLRSAAQIHGNIIKTEKSIKKNEITKFIQSLEKYLTQILGQLHRQLNQYNFGHHLFSLKQKVMQFSRKKLRKHLESLSKLLVDALKGGKNLGETLGYISQSLLDKLGIPINVGFIESVIPEIVPIILSQVIKQKKVQRDPSLLEGLFVFYNIKDKTRIPIQYTGDSFMAMDDNANRHFDGDLTALGEELANGRILPTGPSLILIFAALGCSVTLGGLHTLEYYPEYLENAKNLLEGTGFNWEMKVLGYQDLKLLDTRSMTDIMAATRILEKVGSRAIIKKSTIDLPHDIVDHLNFLASKDEVPSDYHLILQKLLETQKITSPAYERELKRFKTITGWNKLSTEDLVEKIPELKPYFKKLVLEELHPERLKMAVETLSSDTEMRMEKLEENIHLEQHLLGGKITKATDDDTESDGDANYGYDDENISFTELYGGILIRSKRVPTLIEMVLYNTPLKLNLIKPIVIKESASPYFYAELMPAENIPTILSEKPFMSYGDFNSAFSALIPKELLPRFFK